MWGAENCKSLGSWRKQSSNKLSHKSYKMIHLGGYWWEKRQICSVQDTNDQN